MVGHLYRLTDEGEESVEVFEVGVEPSQAVVVEQLKKLVL